MALRILTSWEVDEFIGEVSIRPTMWLGKAKLWVRRRAGEHQFAVKFVEEEPSRFRVYVKTLSTQTQEEAERYVEWLVNKLTSYGDRKRIERILLRSLRSGESLNIEELAIEITKPSEEEPVMEEEEHTVEVEVPQVFTPLPVPRVLSVPPPKRSRYLQNLLKGK